jgi:hypothetical protein
MRSVDGRVISRVLEMPLEPGLLAADGLGLLAALPSVLRKVIGVLCTGPKPGLIGVPEFASRFTGGSARMGAATDLGDATPSIPLSRVGGL